MEFLVWTDYFAHTKLPRSAWIRIEDADRRDAKAQCGLRIEPGTTDSKAQTRRIRRQPTDGGRQVHERHSATNRNYTNWLTIGLQNSSDGNSGTNKRLSECLRGCSVDFLNHSRRVNDDNDLAV